MTGDAVERAGAARAMRVVVTVGSDHHPFDRLVRWVDDWASRNPDASVWVQYGSSTPPTVAAGVAFAPHPEVLERIGAADAVVTAGGPGTLMEIRAAGLRPIMVPRRSSLEEHVDGHQRAFARRAAQERLTVTCERAAELWAELDAARADPRRLRLTGDERAAQAAEPPARARVGELIDALIASRRA